jgi:hypothetical protein
MIALSQVIRTLIDRNPLLRFGMHHGLLNLSKTAEFLHPMIELRAKKEVSRGSIMMQLSRLSRDLQKITPEKSSFRSDHLTLDASLAAMTYDRTPATTAAINKVLAEIVEKDHFLTLNRGAHELTLIVDSELSEQIQEAVRTQPKNITAPVAAISIHFDEKYAEIPGFMYYVIQQITLQGINLVEVTSTYTELTIFVAQKDARLAFDTLYLLVDEN